MYKPLLDSYPKAILHIDGDSFFASCEVAKNPALKGKPVVIGQERGIASALTYEAKNKGVRRGMRISEIKKLCPDVILLPSDYETYSLYSMRMYAIVRRYTIEVDEYSIDECFADITGLRSLHNMSYEKIAEKIKNELYKELGITFSVGLGTTKTLAKIGSKWNKPNGLTCIPFNEINNYLNKTNIGNVWGIGKETTSLLNKYKIITAYDFINKDESYLKNILAKPYLEIWHELNGRVIYEINKESKHIYKSISKTRTFTPPSKNKQFIFSQLSKNIENACIKARRHKLATPEIYFFLKTQDFKYTGMCIKLSNLVSTPEEIIKVVDLEFSKIYKENIEYRATGIILSKLTENKINQMDLFGNSILIDKTNTIYSFIDILSVKYGKHSIFLGTSMQAMNNNQHGGLRGKNTIRKDTIFKGETKRKKLSIPFLGSAS